MDVDTISQTLLDSKTLDDVYLIKSVILERELSLAEIQAAVSNNYGKIKSTFVNFRNFLKKNC